MGDVFIPMPVTSALPVQPSASERPPDVTLPPLPNIDDGDSLEAVVVSSASSSRSTTRLRIGAAIVEAQIPSSTTVGESLILRAESSSESGIAARIIQRNLPESAPPAPLQLSLKLSDVGLSPHDFERIVDALNISSRDSERASGDRLSQLVRQVLEQSRPSDAQIGPMKAQLVAELEGLDLDSHAQTFSLERDLIRLLRRTGDSIRVSMESTPLPPAERHRRTGDLMDQLRETQRFLEKRAAPSSTALSSAGSASAVSLPHQLDQKLHLVAEGIRSALTSLEQMERNSASTAPEASASLRAFEDLLQSSRSDLLTFVRSQLGASSIHEARLGRLVDPTSRDLTAIRNATREAMQLASGHSPAAVDTRNALAVIDSALQSVEGLELSEVVPVAARALETVQTLLRLPTLTPNSGDMSGGAVSPQRDLRTILREVETHLAVLLSTDPTDELDGGVRPETPSALTLRTLFDRIDESRTMLERSLRAQREFDRRQTELLQALRTVAGSGEVLPLVDAFVSQFDSRLSSSMNAFSVDDLLPDQERLLEFMKRTVGLLRRSDNAGAALTALLPKLTGGEGTTQLIQQALAEYARRASTETEKQLVAELSKELSTLLIRENNGATAVVGRQPPVFERDLP
ncbi:MAG: hypothetical protein IT290_10195, partial [Deltaproteobacteria bacterium]|nr:hypothetical protein [Deltaproteobacteria bacterium]